MYCTPRHGTDCFHRCWHDEHLLHAPQLRYRGDYSAPAVHVSLPGLLLWHLRLLSRQLHRAGYSALRLLCACLQHCLSGRHRCRRVFLLMSLALCCVVLFCFVLYCVFCHMCRIVHGSELGTDKRETTRLPNVPSFHLYCYCCSSMSMCVCGQVKPIDNAPNVKCNWKQLHAVASVKLEEHHFASMMKVCVPVTMSH